MKLKQLLKGLDVEVRGSKEIEITGISADSKTVAPGNLFFAKKGALFDGTQFVPQAIQAGAVAIVSDLYDPFVKATQVICNDIRNLEAAIASRYYGNPSKELFVVGVTGTKGKTTTSYLVQHMLGDCGLIGTVETIVGNRRFYSALTTQEVLTNHKLLREMAMAGCQSAVMEVSSHGLDQGRVDEIEFDAGIFTNLYPDHLDYHKTMEAYAAAKRELFQKVKERAIINVDNPWTAFMREGCKAPVWTFGLEKKADLMADRVVFTSRGTEFEVKWKGQCYLFKTSLIGRHNVYNLLGAIAVGLHKGLSIEEIRNRLDSFRAVPGRLEPVQNDLGLRIYVDFAHNGEALENVLKTVREISEGRVIVVFGCGGNRDPGRRTGMAQAAENYADVAIVTSDNPRQEDPMEICRQILSAFKQPGKAILEIDRTRAIQAAIKLANEKDIVLIAGKGHERFQIFAHQTVPFDDIEIARKCLNNRADSAILPDL